MACQRRRTHDEIRPRRSPSNIIDNASPLRWSDASSLARERQLLNLVLNDRQRSGKILRRAGCEKTLPDSESDGRHVSDRRRRKDRRYCRRRPIPTIVRWVRVGSELSGQKKKQRSRKWVAGV